MNEENETTYLMPSAVSGIYKPKICCAFTESRRPGLYLPTIVLVVVGS